MHAVETSQLIATAPAKQHEAPPLFVAEAAPGTTLSLMHFKEPPKSKVEESATDELKTSSQLINVQGSWYNFFGNNLQDLSNSTSDVGSGYDTVAGPVGMK